MHPKGIYSPAGSPARTLASLFIVAVVACGGGGGGGDANQQVKPATPAAAPAAAPGKGSGSGKPLPLMRHAEDRVICPIPNKGSPKCDLNAQKPVALDGQTIKKGQADLWCEEGEVCQNTQDGYMCVACPEKFAIRRELKETDFAPTNRDPFTPSVGRLPGQGSAGSADAGTIKDSGGRCVRKEQMRVSNYGYQDLRLVGIVAQGTQRKVLMMDPGNYGHIIKRGDCVGKEKARVREIGDNFVCFELTGDAATTARGPKEFCPELHTKQINVTSIPDDSPDPSRISTTPVLPPTARPDTGSGAGSAGQPPTVIRP